MREGVRNNFFMASSKAYLADLPAKSLEVVQRTDKGETFYLISDVKAVWQVALSGHLNPRKKAK